MRDRFRELIKKLVPRGSVVQQAAKGGVWMTMIRFLSQGSYLLMLLVLARLLSPRDFGILGVALLTLSAMKRFSDVGINTALVQQKAEDIDEYLNTAWMLAIGRGVLIAVVLFLAAPYIARFFGEANSELTAIIRVIAFSPLLSGLQNPAVVYFQKDLEFHKEFVYQTTSSFARFFVGIGYALVSPTVWALVAGFVSVSASKVVLSYVLHDYRPRPSVDRETLWELVHFGKWITGSSITQFLHSEGDDVFVGWFLSATALGFYQYAHRIADMPASQFTAVISSVTFPAYSKLQDDPAALRDALLGTTRLVAVVVFPVSAGMALIAPSFVPVVLGEQWTPMILPLQLLSVFGLLHGITRYFGGVFNALERPDYNMKLDTIRIACLAVVIWPATAQWGVAGTAGAIIGVYLFPMFPLDVYAVSTLTRAHPLEILHEYLYPTVGSAVMFGTLWYAHGLLDVTPLFELLFTVPAGAVVYTLSVLLLDELFSWGIKRDLRYVVAEVQS
ncbi:lipopolysaccharide biosynthesis protein [Halorubrum tebenquichense]|uniref:Membrane protein involved in the export of O-antigen and teichoic acid n=1 Tax=Halorubrum tebenquichense DSM 14210 TaxID=1227485 RepID=M0DCG3_9EURY|nr:lipopolysaccharide biosynthesis protein [Halorubrum tebenquichense]ELZ33150.1 membrane protein involved in the export of O-antigen and teichoic acid [Halorubrum tebenquichense DSM 14210]